MAIQRLAIAIWIRVSSEDQAKGESPAHHLERARHCAAGRGWTVKEVYDLAGISGKSVKDHPECKRMLADIKRGHITGLIFSKLARLAVFQHDHRGLLARGDFVTRRKERRAADEINQLCQFGQIASGGIAATHIARK
jgi:DNA invertase Pin-like site-specific DNA recombinase